MADMADSTFLAENGELLAEIRERLQSAHFAARDMRRFELVGAREPIADQLHAIRLLAEELEARLAA